MLIKDYDGTSLYAIRGGMLPVDVASATYPSIETSSRESARKEHGLKLHNVLKTSAT